MICLDVPCLSDVEAQLRPGFVFHQRWHERLAADHTLVRMDFRGTGASSRNPTTLTLEALRSDILAVADELCIERFSLFARDGGVPVAIDLAANQVDRLDRLVLYNGWFDGPNLAAHATMGKWEDFAVKDWPFYTSVLAEMFIGAKGELANSVAEFIVTNVSAEEWNRFLHLFCETDVRESLSRITCPTLVLHPGRNHLSSLEASRKMASIIPSAELVSFDEGMLPFANADGVAEVVLEFLRHGRAGRHGPFVEQLTRREEEVLSLLSRGMTNRQIAKELVIELNTANRHVSNILAKTGAANRTQAVLLARGDGNPDARSSGLDKS